MYHCSIRFRMIGEPCGAFEVIRTMPPLEHFDHEFTDDRANVVLINLDGRDPAEELKQFAHREENVPLIVLARPEQIARIVDVLTPRDALWTLPMSEQEARFRFRQWQEAYKREKDLWLSEQYLETVINTSPSMVWFKDRGGIHVKVNQVFCDVVNKTREQAEGRDHCAIWDVGPEEAEICAQSDREVMESRRTCVGEENVQRGEALRILTTYKAPLYDIDGTVMGTVGLGVDITQERAYQKALEERAHVLETLFTSLNCGILCHSLDGSKILSVNKAALNLLGYSSQEELVEAGFEMVAQSVLDEDKPVLRAAIQSLTREGDSVDVEYRVAHSNGQVLHVMGNVKLIRENGELCYQRFLLDWTAQKLQENKKERHQQELVRALAVDYSLVCYFDLDTGRGKTLQIDEKNRLISEAFTGEYDLDEVMGAYIDTQVHEEDREMMRGIISKKGLLAALDKENQLYLNYRLVWDGKIRYYNIKVVRAGNWDESHAVVVGVRSVDAETRKEMEHRQALESALVQANQANQAKSAFLFNISHDIRTPMNAIIGFTNLAIAHMNNAPQVSEYLGKIKTSGDHMLRLINDVLDMSQIESGKAHLEEAPCALMDVLSDLQGIMQAEVQERKLDFSIETVALEDTSVSCDVLRLNQVLINVVSNAVKYTEPGGRVTLRLTEKPKVLPNCADYEFQVADTGIGMTPEFLERIFEPFERERNTTSSGVLGTGLGMAITKNVVDMMGGTIKVDSEKGVGTTVTVTLPFHLMENDGAAAPQEKTDRAAGSHTGRILLVEDNELNREIAAAILEDEGFGLEMAENGQIAVDMLTAAGAGYYKLILMDVQMPVMNGYEATRAIRALPDKDLASIPILAMTANAFEEDKREAIRQGMNGHIAKPIDIDKLMAAIAKFMD